MNGTDDASLFYAVSEMPSGGRRNCVSNRNGSEPQMRHAQFLHASVLSDAINVLNDIAGAVFGSSRYRTKRSSASACRGAIVPTS